MKYYSAIKRNKVLIRTTTHMNPVQGGSRRKPHSVRPMPVEFQQGNPQTDKQVPGAGEGSDS